MIWQMTHIWRLHSHITNLVSLSGLFSSMRSLHSCPVQAHRRRLLPFTYLTVSTQSELLKSSSITPYSGCIGSWHIVSTVTTPFSLHLEERNLLILILHYEVCMVCKACRVNILMLYYICENVQNYCITEPIVCNTVSQNAMSSTYHFQCYK